MRRRPSDLPPPPPPLTACRPSAPTRRLQAGQRLRVGAAGGRSMDGWWRMQQAVALPALRAPSGPHRPPPLSPLPLRSPARQAVDRRERLRRLALETIDLSKDPYFMRNHLGQYECRLCLTLHTNEGNYLAHTQGEPPPWVCTGCSRVLHARHAAPPRLLACMHAPGLLPSPPAAADVRRTGLPTPQASGISRTWRSARRGRQPRSRWPPRRSAAWPSRRRCAAGAWHAGCCTPCLALPLCGVGALCRCR